MRGQNRTSTDTAKPLVTMHDWRRLSREYRAGFFALNAMRPIARACQATMFPGDMRSVGYFLSYQAERAGVDSSNLLAFLESPDPFAKLDAANVVVARLAQRMIAGELDESLAAHTPTLVTTPRPSLPDASHYTVAETADKLKCDVATVKRLIAIGRLPADNIGTGKHKEHRVRAESLAILAEKPVLTHKPKMPRKKSARPPMRLVGRPE